MSRPKRIFILFSVLSLLSCDLKQEDQAVETESLIGSWQQVEKRMTLAAGWVPLGSGSFYIVTFESGGTHTIQQGNFINRYDCTGTWLASGNALTMTHDCGHGESENNVHFSIEDDTLTWVYDFSETGKKFVRNTNGS